MRSLLEESVDDGFQPECWRYTCKKIRLPLLTEECLHGHFTRATLHGILQEKCRASD